MPDFDNLTLTSTPDLIDELGRRTLAVDNGALIIGISTPSEDNRQKPVLRLHGYGNHPPTTQQLVRGLCNVFQLRSTSGEIIIVPAPVFPEGKVEITSAVEESPKEVEQPLGTETSVTVMEIVDRVGDLLSHLPESVVTRGRPNIRIQSRLPLTILGEYLSVFGYSRLPQHKVEPNTVLPPEGGFYLDLLGSDGGMLYSFVSNASPVAIAVIDYEPKQDAQIVQPLREVTLVSRSWMYKLHGQ